MGCKPIRYAYAVSNPATPTYRCCIWFAPQIERGGATCGRRVTVPLSHVAVLRMKPIDLLDASSSVIYGMPKAAFEMGAVARQLTLGRIGHEVVRSCDTSLARSA